MSGTVRTWAASAATLVGVGLALAADGDVQWQEKITGPPDTYRGAWSAVVAKKRLILRGSNRPATDRSAFTVWAVHPRSGAVLWENHIIRTPTKVSEVGEIAAKGRYVVAVGRTDSPEGGRAFSVVGYDVRDGSVLWQDHFDREGDLRDTGQDVAIGRRTAVAVGTTATAEEGNALTVRAYDLKRGDLLWEDLYDGEPGRVDVATSVAIRGKRVFVTGTLGTDTGWIGTIRAYDLRDGRLLWRDVYDDGSTTRDSFLHVAVSGPRVFVVGSSSNDSPSSSLVVRAYAGKTADVLWTRTLMRGPGAYESPATVAVTGKNLVVGGRSSIDGNGAFSVRALNALDGELLWEYHRDRADDALGWDYDGAQVVAIGRKAVYAGGTVGTAEVGSAIAVIALGRRDGQEIVTSVIAATDEARCWSGTKAGARLYLAGETEHANGDWSVPVISVKAR